MSREPFQVCEIYYIYSCIVQCQLLVTIAFMHTALLRHGPATLDTSVTPHFVLQKCEAMMYQCGNSVDCAILLLV